MKNKKIIVGVIILIVIAIIVGTVLILQESKTKPEEIEPLLKEVDLVLVMSVEPGFGGQSFLESAYNKVKYLKNYKDIHHLNYYIEVDGGVNDVTGPKLLEIGTDVLVTGSYLMKGNPEDNLKKLNK